MGHTFMQKAGYMLILLLLVSSWVVTFFILVNFFLYLRSLVELVLEIAQLG